ncbi:MAG: hypothetical protein LUD19_00530 [Clostridia bacterium]|nr:hypothetical protein [Clostridia bacterium]
MKVLYTVISAAAALAFAAGTSVSIYFESGLWYLIAYIVLCLIFFPLSGYLHELGHAIFGAASGMKVGFIKTNMFSTSACTVSPKRGGNIKKRLITTCSGGLVINFILLLWGVIALCIPAVNNLFSFTAPASVYLFILNAIPAEYASGKTDMLVIKEAVKNEPTAQVLTAILDIQGELATGTNLADIAEERLINLPQLPDDDYNFAMLTSLRRDYYLAKGDRQTADIYYLRLRDLGYKAEDFKN